MGHSLLDDGVLPGKGNDQDELAHLLRISQGKVQRDHPALRYADKVRFWNLQLVHALAEIVRHLFGGVGFRKIVLPAESKDGVFLCKHPIQKGEGNGRAPNGSQAVPHTGNQNQVLFPRPKPNIIHTGFLQFELTVFSVKHKSPPSCSEKVRQKLCAAR